MVDLKLQQAKMPADYFQYNYEDAIAEYLAEGSTLKQGVKTGGQEIG